MRRICGIDECGRGPLAGPLVAAATALSSKHQIPITKDSKQLSAKQRERFYKIIMESGAIVAVEMISVRQINTRGIGWANKEIFKRLIKKIEASKYIVDGNLKIKMRNKNVKSVIKADSSRKCVMAASIVAKVTRDRLMEQLHKEFPNYRWNENAGYGTKKHIEAIKAYGVTKHHRDIFVRTALRSVDRPEVA